MGVKDRPLDAGSAVVPCPARVADLRHATEADADAAGHRAFPARPGRALPNRSASRGRRRQHRLRTAADDPAGQRRLLDHRADQVGHQPAMAGRAVVGAQPHVDARRGENPPRRPGIPRCGSRSRASPSAPWGPVAADRRSGCRPRNSRASARNGVWPMPPATMTRCSAGGGRKAVAQRPPNLQDAAGLDRGQPAGHLSHRLVHDVHRRRLARPRLATSYNASGRPKSGSLPAGQPQHEKLTGDDPPRRWPDTRSECGRCPAPRERFPRRGQSPCQTRSAYGGYSRADGLMRRCGFLDACDARLAEGVEFFAAERSNGPGRQFAQPHRTDGRPHQAEHLVADLGQQAADFAVLAFRQHHFQQRAVLVMRLDGRLFRPGKPLGQVDAAANSLEHLRLGLAGDLDQIGFRHFVAGVAEPVGEFAVVGHQDQPLAVQVEPSHGKQPDAAGRDQVDHPRPARRVAIASRPRRPACSRRSRRAGRR